MKASAKIGLVVGGYVIAAALSAVVVAVYVRATSGPDRQTYAAMYDFGDSLLFLGVFGVTAAFPTGAALYFLRPFASFWRVLSILALLLAATALAGAADVVASNGTLLGRWAAFASLEILIAPLFAVGFGLCAVFAPTRSARIALLVAGFIEAAAFASLAVTWAHGAPRREVSSTPTGYKAECSGGPAMEPTRQWGVHT